MREITENDIEMFVTLNKLRHLSKCIDKQVTCIIVDEFNNILSIGVNTIEACDQNCADKEKRVCVVRHAEVVAIDNLSTINRQRARRAYVSLFPCAPCQHALAPFVDEIVTFGMAHKKWESGKVVVFPHLIYKAVEQGARGDSIWDFPMSSEEATVNEEACREVMHGIHQEEAHAEDPRFYARLRAYRVPYVKGLLLKFAGRTTCKTIQDKEIGNL